MPITLGDSFKVAANVPLDNRSKVSTYNELESTLNRGYLGLIVQLTDPITYDSKDYDPGFYQVVERSKEDPESGELISYLTIAPKIFNEYNIQLKDELYTYANIGKITGASNENPQKIAESGADLKSVFKAIFGEQENTDPRVSANVRVSASSDFTGYPSGLEYGSSVSKQEFNVTFEVTNNGQSNYGYKLTYTNDNNEEESEFIKGSSSFKYPIQKQSLTGNDGEEHSGDIIIECEGIADGVTLAFSGLQTSIGNTYLCNLTSDNEVTVTISIPAQTITDSEPILINSIEGSVKFNTPEGSSAAHPGELKPISGFLKLQGDVSENSSVNSYLEAPSDKADDVGPYELPAATYYPYYTTSSSESFTDNIIAHATKSSIGNAYSSGAEIPVEDAAYIWFITPSDRGSCQIEYFTNNDWYKFGDGTAEAIQVTLTLSTNSQIQGKYYAYRSMNKAASNSSIKFRLVQAQGVT